MKWDEMKGKGREGKGRKYLAFFFSASGHPAQERCMLAAKVARKRAKASNEGKVVCCCSLNHCLGKVAVICSGEKIKWLIALYLLDM